MNAGSLVLGLLNGMTYGLLAVGLVLVYKSNRFLNLAHGFMGILSAQILAKLVIDAGWNWWAALAVSLPLGVAVGLAIDRWAIRPLRERRASPAALLLVTVGLTQLLLGVSMIEALGPDGTRLSIVGYPLPFQSHVRVGGVVLNGADIFTAVAVPVLILALAAFLQLTVLGKSIRAAASNPEAARLSGVSTRRVSVVVWAIAGGLSALTAILQAPSQASYSAASLGPYLLFLALGAAALAAFVSIPLAMAGGVVLGLAQQLTLAETASQSKAELVVFVIVLAIVVVRGRAIGQVFSITGGALEDLAPLRLSAAAARVGWIRHRNRIFPAAAVVVGLILPLVPLWSSDGRRFQMALIPIYIIGALSLTVGLGWAGQISLGQFALVGAGAFVAGRLLQDNWTLLFVVIIAGLVGALVMMVVGSPALRVPGLTLAVTTLGLAIVGPDWLFRQGWFGTSQAFGLILTPPLVGHGLGRPYDHVVVYYIGLALVVVAGAALATLRKTQAGRALIAVRDNGPAAASFALTPTTVKLGAMALSGFLAAAAGVLWADDWRNVTTAQFSPQLSLILLAIPVIGGAGSVGGTIAAAVLFEASTLFVAPHLATIFSIGGASSAAFQALLGGVGLTYAVLRSPGGLAAAVHDRLQRHIDGLGEAPAFDWEAPERPTLVAEGIALNFGGVRALDGASVEVQPGEIVGLIGPNGAGKTTLLNVIFGALTASEGAVRLGGVDLTGFAPEIRAAYGLGRSFQDARLFPGLTVTEAVQLGVAKGQRATMVASAAGLPWVRSAERDTAATAGTIIDELGLSPWASSLTADLSTGTRRICDLAAQVAARPKVLLLDEPTAGVAQREAEAFGPLLKRIRDRLDCSILIVEHDMPMLMGLCDRVYAMVSGRVVAVGTPEEIRSDPAVIASYLGTDEVAVARSGARKAGPAPAARPARKGTARAANGSRKASTPAR